MAMVKSMSRSWIAQSVCTSGESERDSWARGTATFPLSKTPCFPTGSSAGVIFSKSLRGKGKRACKTASLWRHDEFKATAMRYTSAIPFPVCSSTPVVDRPGSFIVVASLLPRLEGRGRGVERRIWLTLCVGFVSRPDYGPNTKCTQGFV